MAYKETLVTQSIIATVDLSASQYLLVTQAGALATAGISGRPIQDTPASGEVGSIGARGVSKAVAGAIVAVGALLASDGSGKVVLATSGDFIIGTAVTAAAAADEVISIRVHDAGATV